MTRRRKAAQDETPAQPEAAASAAVGPAGAEEAASPDEPQQASGGEAGQDAAQGGGIEAATGAAETVQDGVVAPKRRRGSRGGRRHRKGGAGGEGTARAAEGQSATAANGDRAATNGTEPKTESTGVVSEAEGTVVETVVTAADGAGASGDAPAASKRRRRGSRGGRRRHKAAEAGAAEAAREAEEAAGEQLDAESLAAAAAAEPSPGPEPGAEIRADEEASPQRPRRRARGRGKRGAEAPAAAAVGEEQRATAPAEAGLPEATIRGGADAAGAGDAGQVAASKAAAGIGAGAGPTQGSGVEEEAARTGQAEANAAGKPVTRRRGRRRGAEPAAQLERDGGSAAEPTSVSGRSVTDAEGAGAGAEGAGAEGAGAEAGAVPGTGSGSDDAEGEGDGRRPRRRGGRRARSKRELEPEETAEAVVAVEEDDVTAEARPGKSRRAKAPALVAAEEAGEPDDEAVVVVEEPAVKIAEPAGEKGRRRDRRRPRAIVRQDEGSGLATAAEPSRRPAVVAELPKRKIILVSDDGHELRVGLVEDGRLAEIYIERPDKKSFLGDIYQGKVENVMTGIDAAFVDFGLEKNGFLYVDEVLAPDGEKRARRIGDALKRGQQVLVQVTKDPMGSKGARLSTKISLAGRYLVYVPGGSGVGISRRLKQSERDRLRDLAKQLKPKNAGLIVRTIAEGRGLDELKRDLRYLSRLWSRLKKKAEGVKPPGLVHKEVDISIEVARDLFNETCESLIVDDPKRHKALVAFLDKEAPELLPKVHLHTGEEPLFEAYGIEEQISRALERRVPLPSGGNLMIDHAEALTVIDVNTGRFAGGKGLEETITHTNLEAAKEVVRQLRLRDIGGIIIIDFIDMARAKNREMVLATLEAELETDRTKTYVVELSPLGLVEMTRQNTTDGARGILTRTCPVCLGKARIMNDESMALTVERRVRSLARRSTAKAWLIEVHPAVAERIAGPRLKELEKETGRRIFFEGSGGLPVDAFRVVSEGTLAHVQGQRIPVREGQEVEVELEFSLTYSPRDAVGYIDGYMVIVEGGRQFLGQRRKVRVTATARTGASAVALRAN